MIKSFVFKIIKVHYTLLMHPTRSAHWKATEEEHKKIEVKIAFYLKSSTLLRQKKVI